MLSYAKREPSAILLVAQLSAVLLYPFMEGSEVGRALFSVFGIAILGLVLLAVRDSPALTWVGVALGVPAMPITRSRATTCSRWARRSRSRPGGSHTPTW